MMRREDFTKYELARVLGARALQISMGAPLLVKISDDELEKLKFDPIRIAEVELDAEILPMSVRRPFPEKKEIELKKAKERPAATPEQRSDEKAEHVEHEEEKEIAEEGEIMELATPEDEVEEERATEEEVE